MDKSVQPNFNLAPDKEDAVTPAPPTITNQVQLPSRTNFISIDEGIKQWEDQEKLDAQLAREQNLALSQGKPVPGVKAVKKGDDADLVAARAAEAVAKEEMGEKSNWIGKLTEYRAAHPKENGLVFEETSITNSSVGTRFRCAVRISESLQVFGGSNTISFTTKKDAKKWAAKKAVDWLIGNGFMPKDGGVRFPTGKNKQPSTPTSSIAPPPSAAAQVPDLCHKLGIILPSYKLEKAGNSENIYDGHAIFEGVPWIDGPVGEFEGIIGRKQAKEACAEKILSFLRDVQRQRNPSADSSLPVSPLRKSSISSPLPRPASLPPKPPTPTTATSPTAKAPAATRVPTLCNELGFRMPTYAIEKSPQTEDLPLYDGYAHFDGDPRLPGKIGEVRGVYGKKNTKERCAEVVLEHLLRIERQRRVVSDRIWEGDEALGKRKRSEQLLQDAEKAPKIRQ
ncbi:hypothetical protein PVAG01_02772 [Phlyctema vagabunda]|uniref:DRBM domain-containing protein n=1 Tax=Phlyctema vagabunda TaxID=108571 RepID=A0ABR4PRS1_9HELO